LAEAAKFTEEGVLLRVRVTPKAQRDEVTGIVETEDGSAVRVRVRAAPEDGKGNRAVIETIAEVLGVAKSTISIKAGAKTRNKLLFISGSARPVREKLAARLAELHKE
jgi:uncharacterized protein (TIGR00251 family)